MAQESSDPTTELWRQQRKGSVGCAMFVFSTCAALAVLAFLFAPLWVFWLVLVPLGLLSAGIGMSTMGQLRRADVFIREASGGWRISTPSRRSAAEIRAIWDEVRRDHAIATMTGGTALRRALGDPAALGETVAILEEHSDEPPGYWVCVEVLNHYEQELRNLRTLVRNEMPGEPPEGVALDGLEAWLSEIIGECEAVRAGYVHGRASPGDFAEKLGFILDAHVPPHTIEDEVRALETGSQS